MARESALPGRVRVLVIALGLGLAAMLAASLAERFTSPGLTVRHFAAQTGGDGQTPPGAPDEVGRLMQEVARDPGNRAALMQIAERLMAMGSWDGAEGFATRALALDPQDARTRYLLGVIRHNQGKHAEAAKLLEEALRTQESAPMRYSLGILYLHYLKDPARGVEHLSMALHDPDADESLRQSIRAELEKAPLPGAGENRAEEPPAVKTAPERKAAPRDGVRSRSGGGADKR